MNITSADLKKILGGGGSSKYRNKPTMYMGLRYVSKAEADYASHLDTKVMVGSVKWWLKNSTAICLGVPENRYVPDFLVVEHNGPPYFVDVKGVRTAKFNRDIKLWKTYGPCVLVIAKRHGKAWDCDFITPTGATT